MKGATQTVDDQCCQCFAVDVFGDDQQRLALLDDLFQHRNHVLDVADLLFEDQHISVFEDGFHRPESVTKYGDK